MVLQVLHEFQGIIWHVSDGGARSPELVKRQRALGPYPGLVSGMLVAKQTIELDGQTWYGDVGWLSSTASEQLERLYGRSTASTDSLLAFFRSPTEKRLNQWKIALLGALWAWARRAAADGDRTESDSEALVLQRLLQVVLDAQGLMALLADVEGTGRVLLLVGGEAACRELKTRLGTKRQIDWVATLNGLGRPQWLAWLT